MAGSQKEGGLPYLIVDGEVVAVGRCLLKTASRKGEASDLWYSRCDEFAVLSPSSLEQKTHGGDHA
jgi:hypothetical protein